MRPGVHEKDGGRKWRETLDRLRGVGDAFVSVGYHADAEPYESGQGTPANVAQVASFHEYGDGVPQRATMRPTVDANRDVYGGMLERGLGKVIDGTLPLKKALGLVGTKVEADIKQAIVDLKEPGLADSTIAAKLAKSGLRGAKAEEYEASGANPLVDTAHMLRSVTHKVEVGGQ